MTTTYSPTRNEDFDSKSLMFNGTGVSGIAASGSVTNIDYHITQDSILAGGYLLIKGSLFGDTVTQQVIDIDGVLAPSGTVIRQFMTNWNVADDTQIHPGVLAGYPAKIYSGLYLRLIYNSTGTNDVKVAINYALHKVLF